MPTLANSNIPIPKSWEEFEEIVLSALKIKWLNPNLLRNGRQGQPQNGVDIYGEDSLGYCVGAQCKLIQSGNIDIATIKEEIAKAEKFEPSIEAYYIVTTALPDARIQKEIRLLSQERKNQGKFLVGIFFWQDIVQELLRDESEFRKHYPELANLYGNDQSKNNKIVEHDTTIFYAANTIMAEKDLIELMDELQTDDSYYSEDKAKLVRFRFFFEQESNKYISLKLQGFTDELVGSLQNLEVFLSVNFFVYPDDQQQNNLRLCMYPDLNIDRGGKWDKVTMEKYNDYQRILDSLAEEVRQKYREYRNAIKLSLYI